ncbi:MAG TPA: hypothetical protein VHF26_03480 [Trebonia sp.]|nr:hypothetical protein [Trebonia sp.]
MIAVLRALGAYAAYTVYQRFVTQVLTVPGCQAGTGNSMVPLDFQQAADAATIAGVAVREGLPSEALTIAYATAFQESKLENPDYGDRDSVGVFQQRPSQGWGTAAELEDPAFAARAFFGKLVKVPDYTKIPVWQAAQDVQASADGYAYEQYAQSGKELAADYTARPAAVTCWYNPAQQAAAQGVSAKLNLHGAATGLDDVFGTPGQDGSVLTGVSRVRSGSADVITTAPGAGWAVANWLVANALSYGITQVSYAGYQWTAGLSETSWQPATGAAKGQITVS